MEIAVSHKFERTEAICGSIKSVSREVNAIVAKHAFNTSATGLTPSELAETRWKVDDNTAKLKLVAYDLPAKGRRYRLVYTWHAIFLAEGFSSDYAAVANKGSAPSLFENLISPHEAAFRLGVSDISYLRKLALSGVLPPESYVAFGSRGIRRFRPAYIEVQRNSRLFRSKI